MKKLNEKGMTTVEILVCFVLIVGMTVSMYHTVSVYKNKQQIESVKEKVTTYKNLLTKEIQDDLIKKGLFSANVTNQYYDKEGNEKTRITDIVVRTKTTVSLIFRDGSKKNLIIEQQKAHDYEYTDQELEIIKGGYASVSQKVDDEFMISYGTEGAETKYPIPELGYGINQEGNKIQDLRIQTVNISTDDNILSIKVDFYHVDLANKYRINIVCPINF